MTAPAADAAETRPVCPACGHISGAHLERCRIAALEREAAELRADAERYRWLRDENNDGGHDYRLRIFDERGVMMDKSEFDAAIDEAISALRRGEG